MRKRTLDMIRDFSTTIPTELKRRNDRENPLKIENDFHMDLVKLHEEVAAYGHLMRQCRALHNQFIRATKHHAFKDAHMRIKNFIDSWEDPNARLWSIHGEQSVSEFTRPDHGDVIFSRDKACNHELRFGWYYVGIYARLQRMFLRRSPGISILYQKAYTVGTTEFYLVVPLFNHVHLRYNKEDLGIVTYGVYLVEYDDEEELRKHHIITDDVRYMLWSQTKDPLRTVSKTFLWKFKGFQNIMMTIGIFCATPYAPYRFKARYGRNS